MADIFGRANSHTRRFPKEERLKRSKEARDLWATGKWKKWQIAKQLRMDVRTVEKVIEGRDEFKEILEATPTGDPTPLVFEPLAPEPIPDAPPSESESVEFLRNARDNPRLAWSDRIKCALAVAKLESGDSGETWKPPQDNELWAEALADAIQAQVPEVRGMVSVKLTTP